MTLQALTLIELYLYVKKQRKHKRCLQLHLTLHFPSSPVILQTDTLPQNYINMYITFICSASPSRKRSASKYYLLFSHLTDLLSLWALTKTITHYHKKTHQLFTTYFIFTDERIADVYEEMLLEKKKQTILLETAVSSLATISTSLENVVQVLVMQSGLHVQT